MHLTAYRDDSAGMLQLNAPAGWIVTPPQQSFDLHAVGDQTALTFTVTAPPQPTTGSITARAKIGDATYDNERIEIRYSHIPVQLLQPPRD